MRLMGILVLAAICLSLVCSYGVRGWILSEEEDLELERQLELINKQPLKTIQTEYGDTIDCIDINKQLAFDHPLLKNHKIQRRPSTVLPKETKDVYSLPAKLAKIGLNSTEACPSGSVPIRRTSKEDLVRMRAVTNAVAVQNPSETYAGSHFAVLRMKKRRLLSYYGAKANINTWNPDVDNDESSTAQIWIESGSQDVLTSIQAGWMVSPQLYGDAGTYLSTYWTADGYQKTGCYNAVCSGFVQTDKKVFLGAHITQTSIYNGAQYEIVVHVYQDPATKNWWLVVQDINIGYWPAALFTSFANGAEQVGWGGRATGPPNGPSPQMGSGYFPDDNYYHSGSFRQILYKNKSNLFETPQFNSTLLFLDKPKCYILKDYGFQNEYMGYAFMFGGPGGDCGT